MKQITCPICGAQFTTSRPNKKYCSFSCREAGRQLQRLRWEQKNPSYNADYQRKRRAAEKGKKNEAS